jgi:hypothetical protein
MEWVGKVAADVAIILALWAIAEAVIYATRYSGRRLLATALDVALIAAGLWYIWRTFIKAW